MEQSVNKEAKIKHLHSKIEKYVNSLSDNEILYRHAKEMCTDCTEKELDEIAKFISKYVEVLRKLLIELHKSKLQYKLAGERIKELDYLDEEKEEVFLEGMPSIEEILELYENNPWDDFMSILTNKITDKDLVETEKESLNRLTNQQSKIRVVKAQNLILKALSSKELEGITAKEVHLALAELLYSYLNKEVI